MENEARKGVESTRAFIAVTTNISFVPVCVYIYAMLNERGDEFFVENVA